MSGNKLLKYGAVAFIAWMAFKAWQTMRAIETGGENLRRLEDYR